MKIYRPSILPSSLSYFFAKKSKKANPLSPEAQIAVETLQNPKNLKILLDFMFSLIKSRTNSNFAIEKQTLQMFHNPNNIPSSQQINHIIKNDLISLKIYQIRSCLENFFQFTNLNKFFKPTQQFSKEEIKEKKLNICQKLTNLSVLKMNLRFLQKVIAERNKRLIQK